MRTASWTRRAARARASSSSRADHPASSRRDSSGADPRRTLPGASLPATRDAPPLRREPESREATTGRLDAFYAPGASAPSTLLLIECAVDDPVKTHRLRARNRSSRPSDSFVPPLRLVRSRARASRRRVSCLVILRQPILMIVLLRGRRRRLRIRRLLQPELLSLVRAHGPHASHPISDIHHGESTLNSWLVADGLGESGEEIDATGEAASRGVEFPIADSNSAAALAARPSVGTRPGSDPGSDPGSTSPRAALSSSSSSASASAIIASYASYAFGEDRSRLRSAFPRPLPLRSGTDRRGDVFAPRRLVPRERLVDHRRLVRRSRPRNRRAHPRRGLRRRRRGFRGGDVPRSPSTYTGSVASVSPSIVGDKKDRVATGMRRTLGPRRARRDGADARGVCRRRRNPVGNDAGHVGFRLFLPSHRARRRAVDSAEDSVGASAGDFSGASFFGSLPSSAGVTFPAVVVSSSVSGRRRVGIFEIFRLHHPSDDPLRLCSLVPLFGFFGTRVRV